MKKTRFIPMLLASQLVLGSSLNFTPNSNAGVISTTVEHTIDVLGTAVKCLIIGGTVIGTTVVVATHAKDIVDKMKKRVIQIDKGEIIRDSKGGYSGEV